MCVQGTHPFSLNVVLRGLFRTTFIQKRSYKGEIKDSEIVDD